MFIIFRQDVAKTRLKHVFDIESFIQESLWSETLTLSYIFFFYILFKLIYIFFLKTHAMNILSEPLVNYVILWENRDLQFIKKNWFSIYPESCSSSLHVVY